MKDKKKLNRKAWLVAALALAAIISVNIVMVHASESNSTNDTMPVQQGTGSVYVNTNLDEAYFTVTGPANFSGTGASWTQSNTPAGTYTITYSNEYAECYNAPGSETKTLSAGGSITFNAIYTKKLYSIFLSSSPNTLGLSSTKTYECGNKISITAPPVQGYEFSKWTEENTIVSTNASYSFILNGDRKLVVMYSPAGMIYVNSSIPEASFSITGTANYTGGGKLWQKSAPVGNYEIAFNEVECYATPESQSKALDKGSTAAFLGNYVIRQYTVITSTSLSGLMQLQGASTHNCKAAVTIIAPVIEGYTFSKWAEEGNPVSASASYQFTITKNRTLVAVYENQTIPITPKPTTVAVNTTPPIQTTAAPPATSPPSATEPPLGILKQINETIRSNQAIVAAVITAAATIATSLMLRRKS